MIDAQRIEVDVAKAVSLDKGNPVLSCGLDAAGPGRHEYTTLSLRWPWLHNIGHGNSGSPPSGRPYSGGHLHWLDKDMPRRNG